MVNPDPYLNRYLAELKDVMDNFVKTIRITQSLLIILNSGGVIALADFFTNKNIPPDLTIKLAAVFFIVGVIFALLTLFCDFFIGYFLFNNLLRISTKKVTLDEYYSDDEARLNKTQSVLFWLIVLGVLSLIFWLLGICFIVNYILGVHCKFLMVAVIFMFIFACGIYLFWWLKSKFEWQSKGN